MTTMTKNDRFAAVVEHIEALAKAAPAGSNEKQQWDIALLSVHAARQMGEGNLARGLSLAKTASEAVAGH